MLKSLDFSGKVALVTGAGNGMGRAAAVLFAQAGARVAVCDLDARGGEETVARIRSAGGEAIFVATDVASAAAVAAMVERAVTEFGRLDCAFNNAGVLLENQPSAEWDEELFDRTMRINARGVMLCMKHEIRQMLRQGGGAIVNNASVEAFTGVPGHAGYDASKHAVLGLTRTAAVEYAARGIRVNVVCPGAIRTPMVDAATTTIGGADSLAGYHPMGRIGEPEEVAHAALWLCSDAASFVTGHALAVDGGMLAR